MARILVVDDEPSVLAVVCRALREDDHVVIAVSNNQTACEIAMAEKIDVVVTNKRIPRLSGEVLVDVLRWRLPETPILDLRDHAEARHALFQLPEDVPTLFKPFDLGALKAAVRGLLGSSSPPQPELSFM